MLARSRPCKCGTKYKNGKGTEKLPRNNEQLLRELEARLIDAESAEIHWCYANVLDPYGEIHDFPKDEICIGREYFARRPGRDIWVSFHDLPQTTSTRLLQRLSNSECLEFQNELPF
jgi:hypothetical protein